MISLTYMLDITNNLTLLESLLPAGNLEVTPYKGSLPLWLKQAATYRLVRTREEVEIGLILPMADLDYEILVKIQKQMEKRVNRPFLLVADELNPKYRSLFVRNKIPFIYKRESIFAPTLGFKLLSTGWKKVNKKKPREIDALITPFELKLLAGYLTEYIDLGKFNLDDLQMLLEKNKYQCSKNKLSRVTNELVHRGLLTVTGCGPNRKLQFVGKDEIWHYLLKHNLKPTAKVIEGYDRLPDTVFVYAGENALAQFSDLVPPKKPCYALTNKQYQIVKAKGESIGDYGDPYFYYEIRKEEPKLFSAQDCLNPIELYFELKDHHDERVQIVLDQMIKKINLKVPDNE